MNLHKRIKLITLGCSKNIVDSEHLLKQIAAEEIEIIDEKSAYSSNSAPIDAVIINTCGFIKDAKEESINTILLAVEAKKKGLVSSIIVFGCLSQRYREELVAEIPEVDAFFGAFDLKAVLKFLGIRMRQDLSLKRYLITPKHYAYLKISEGCDRRCSYCAIPLIRGPHKSIPMEDLVAEAENLASIGVKELIIIAQDTTYYGLDLYGKRKLGELLHKLCKIEGIEWIRIHYSYPSSFPEDVIYAIATEPKICKYIDIPLQHSSTKLLKLMRRDIDAVATQKLIDNFRSRIKGVVLRTTMIVGFPGENSKDFEQLICFVKKNKFERLGAFTYSEEEGTYGALKFRDSVRESTKQRRYDRLMEVQSKISSTYNKSRIGSVERVLIDSYSDGILIGRTSKESPDVDGEVRINITKKNAVSKFVPESFIGKFANVKIVGADEYDLTAILID